MIDFSPTTTSRCSACRRAIASTPARSTPPTATLQGEVHPDRFAAAGDAERRLALQSSARVNEAYRDAEGSGRARAVSAVAARRRRDCPRPTPRLPLRFPRAPAGAARSGRRGAVARATSRALDSAARRGARRDAVELETGAGRDARRQSVRIDARATPCASCMFLSKLAADIDACHGGARRLMALLQISEPGESPAPHQRAARGRHRPRHHQFAGRHGAQRHRRRAARRRGPPAAAVGRALRATDGVDVGYAAHGAQADDPQNTIVSVKRLMGRGAGRPRRRAALSLSLRRRAGHGADRDARRRQDARSRSRPRSCARCASAPKRSLGGPI